MLMIVRAELDRLAYIGRIRIRSAHVSPCGCVFGMMFDLLHCLPLFEMFWRTVCSCK